MSSYPMIVVKRSGRANSRSGGKDYHLVLITTADNKAIYIERYGRARQWGHGWKCRPYEDGGAAAEEFAKKARQKFDGEYTEEIVNRADKVGTAAELQTAIGPQYIAQIGRAMLHLDPDFDVSRLKDTQPDTEFDSDGRVKPRARKVLETPPESVEDRATTTPMWGIWG